MGRSELLTSVVKWSEGLSKRKFIIIKRCIHHIRLAAYMAVSFITYFLYSFGSILYHFMYGCTFCLLLFNFVHVSLMCSFREVSSQSRLLELSGKA
jgi:hypothetical protein